MQLYTVTYYHASGSTVDLVRCDHKPSPAEVLSVLNHIEEVDEEAGEYLEIEEYSESAIETIGTGLHKPRVVVVITGGNLQSVYSDVSNLEAIVIDCDNLAADGYGFEKRNEIVEAATAGLVPVL